MTTKQTHKVWYVCDECEKEQATVYDTDNNKIGPAPEGWYDGTNTQKGKHYCSKGCVAKMIRARTEEEIKSL